MGQDLYSKNSHNAASFSLLLAVSCFLMASFCCNSFHNNAAKFSGQEWNFLRNQKVRACLFVFSNNIFQFLNNISRIFIYFFTHTYFHKYFQTTIFNF